MLPGKPRGALELGRMRTWRLPRFSALTMLLRPGPRNLGLRSHGLGFRVVPDDGLLYYTRLDSPWLYFYGTEDQTRLDQHQMDYAMLDDGCKGPANLT